MVSEEKKHGRTYTPETVSSFLSTWAIRSQSDTILEPSVGEGRFVFDAYERLVDLGSSQEDALNSIYGVDIDGEAINRLQEKARSELGKEFPHIEQGDIFDSDFPKADAIIGNPPYVIRHRLDNPEGIINRYSKKYGFSDQADLYCYFIVNAVESLESGGRFAMIVSNSWMKKKYGEEFKEFLLKKLDIKALIGFNERVFEDKLVNSTCIIAEKKDNALHIPDKDSMVRFIRIKNPEVFKDIDTEDNPLNELIDNSVQSATMPQPSLKPEDYWDIWMRAPEVFDSIRTNDMFVSLEKYATPQIGLQTLAKDFYVIEENEADIEDKYLRPIAYSPKDYQNPILETEDCKEYVFWCSDEKSQLKGTNALEYIEDAENRVVEKRYSDETYDGLHNKTRIKEANRNPWYNLTEEAERRLPSQILLPRRVYENYTAVWNKSEAIPNENFLATNVENEEYVKPLLAYLNSSLGELCLRLAGHVYGGGVCDLNVSSSKEISCLDLEKLSKEEIKELDRAFEGFTESQDRDELDKAVFDILDYDEEKRKQIRDALEMAIEESVSKS